MMNYYITGDFTPEGNDFLWHDKRYDKDGEFKDYQFVSSSRDLLELNVVLIGTDEYFRRWAGKYAPEVE
jgi:hypothetical protein